MNYYEDNWIMSDAGNWCLILEDNLVATVFAKSGSSTYGAIINCPDTNKSYTFPGKFEDIEQGKSKVEYAIENKTYCRPPWRPLERGWQRSKKAGNLYLRAAGGIYTIKQASSGSFYVNTQNGGWSCPKTGTRWFDSEEEAQFAADRAIAGGDDGPEEEFDLDSIDFGDSAL